MSWFEYQTKEKQHKLTSYRIIWVPNTVQNACDRVNTPHICGGTVTINVQDPTQNNWYWNYKEIKKFPFSCEDTIEGIKLYIKMTQERGYFAKYMREFLGEN